MITQGYLKKMREKMFNHMQTLPIKYFDTHNHGDIMSYYTNDIDTLRQLISQSIPQLLASGSTSLAVLGIMLYNHVKLETRFYTLINWLTKIDNAVANLDSHTEIIICIFALYIAKCQLPIPLSFLCVISGMVFPINQAIIINVICILSLF